MLNSYGKIIFFLGGYLFMAKFNHQKTFFNSFGGKISLLFLTLILFAGFVSAEHDTTVTIDPNQARCGDLPLDYVVSITNNGDSTDSILEVRIYDDVDNDGLRDPGIVDFTCGNAPVGWTKFDELALNHYCRYTTPVNNSAKISPGETVDFTFNANLDDSSLEACGNNFRIATIDDKFPADGTLKTKFVDIKVDCSAPILEKTVGSPKILMSQAECDSGPFQGEGNDACNYWITQDTLIDVSGSDSREADECNLGLDYCEVTYSLDGGQEQTEIYTELNGENFWNPESFNFNEDSEHVIKVECVDVVGNKTTVFETDKVDDTPPISEKHFEGPQKIEDGVEWIDGVSTVVISTYDPDPTGYSCNIGEVKTYYNLSGAVDDSYCYNSCEGWQSGTPNASGDGWTLYTDHLAEIPESCHVLEYYSVDKIGNIEDVQTNCFFVDKTPPEITKTVGKPQYRCDDGEGCDYYITSDTPINLTCNDQEPHPSGDVVIHYQYRVDEGTGFGDWTPEVSEQTNQLEFSFPEQSMHELEYWCTDAVQKESEHLFEIDKVDNEAPTITKTVVGPQDGTCPPGDGDTCYIKAGETEIHVNAEDVQSIHMVDNVQCKWGYTWDNEFYGWNYPEGTDWTIIFREDSSHELQIVCWDALYNTTEDTETFLVDGKPPVTTKSYVGPQYPDPIVEGETPYSHWISSDTTVNLTSEDEKVGVDKTYYRATQVDDIYCETYASGDCINAQGEGEFMTYTDPFTMEESCHFIEFYSTDKFGNTEEIKNQCVFVDDTPPLVDKTVGEPNVLCDESNPLGCDYYITRKTPVTLNCEDQLPHPVDHVTMKYRYTTSIDCESWGDWSEWFVPSGDLKTVVSVPGTTIYFPEDSCHKMEYYCEDALGNSTDVLSEIDVVDSVPPEISTEVVGPQIELPCEPVVGFSEVVVPDTCTYIDGVTLIEVTATDPDPHPVDNVECEWSYYLDDGELFGPYTEFPINFPEETKHSLEIKCWDELGNTSYKYETYYVDKTPPVTTKQLGTPYFTEDGKEWITTATPISLTVDDAGPHKTGIKETKYRVTQVDNGYCDPANEEFACSEAVGTGDWMDYETSFNAGEESCHLIEYYSKDNVDKTETVNKDCVYVDETGPDPIKTVGEPKTMWDGADSAYYPEIVDMCWTEPFNLECWKVTLLTPVTMACSDPDPHPVDHESIYFMIDFDGDDKTQEYCEEHYQGTYTEDGWCHINQKEVEFYFYEESEHNLKYYCEDALGNVGEVDDEKFKVEGTKFEIELNKKWNLISVPFTLIDDSVETVFDSVSENVESVWTYDAFADEWYAYMPGSPATDLTEIIPGWGYWVRAYEADTLVIGGSLFSPGQTPPDKQLKKGWNLIGYYGTSDGDGGNILNFDGLDGEGKMAGCALFSLGSTYNDKGWTSLLSYWEPFNPNQWLEFDYYDYMDPGAGYWIFTPEDELYAYTTNCGFYN